MATFTLTAADGNSSILMNSADPLNEWIIDSDIGPLFTGDDTVRLQGQYARASVFLRGGDDIYRPAGWNGGAPGSDVTEGLRADTVYGGAGNDSLYGGFGNDILNGELNDDRLDGGIGDDTLFGGDGHDRLFGQAGNDSLFGGNDSDTLQGNDGDDSLAGEAGADDLTGGDGNDTLSGGSEDDDLDGSGGDDSLSGDAGQDTLVGAAGNDWLSGGSENDDLNGGNNDDTLLGGDGNDALSGVGGNDTLLGGAGNDVLDAGAGNDTLQGNDGGDTLNGDGGDDLIIADDGGPGDGSDTVSGGSGNDTIDGGGANDILEGDGGNDSLIGGTGNDSLLGGGGADTLLGGVGDDQLSGGSASDRFVIAYGNGQDTVTDFVRTADTIEFKGIFTNFADAMAHASPSGADIVFDTGGGNSVTVKNAILAHFTAGNIVVTNAPPTLPADSDPGANLVNENAVNGTAVGITAFSSDPDFQPVVYSLTDDAGGRFAIDSNTGVVMVANGALLDFEAATSHSITVQASDGLLTNSAGFVITVGNVAPSAPADSDGTVNSVLEHAANGTAVGIAASASDPAGGGVTYSLADDAGGRFAIDANTGVVTVADYTLIDYENATSHDILVHASDGNLFGSDTLFTVAVAASGNDTFAGTPASDTFYGGMGDDTLSSAGAADTLYGGSGADTVTGGGGNDTVSGGTGSDRYVHNLGDGFDSVIQTSGDSASLDTAFLGSPAFDINWSRDGNDLLIASAIDGLYEYTLTGYLRIVGQYSGTVDPLDYFEADLPNDGGYTFGGAEFSRIYTPVGLTGNDQGIYTELVNGGSANDTITGGGGFQDYLYGYAGDDVITGSSLSPMSGFVTSDAIRGGTGNDSIYGLDGNDRLRGDENDDYLDGGNGSDTAEYHSSPDGVTVTLMTPGTPQFTSTSQGTDTLVNIENLRGSTHNDVLTGDNNANSLRGNSGDDVLSGLGGNDSVRGEDGNDTLDGGIGNDRLEGGAGNDSLFGGDGNDSLIGGGGVDTAVFANPYASYTVVTGGNVTISGGDGTDILQGITYAAFSDLTVIVGAPTSTVTGTSGNDLLTGTEASDTIYGLGGNDTIYGLGSGDYLDGGADNDIIYGGGGNDYIDRDQLFGGAGDDTLYGEIGDHDQLDGGAGNDTLDGGIGFNDLAQYNNATSNIVVDLAAGTVVGGIDVGSDVLISIERVHGGSGNDTMTGTAGYELFQGNGGSDTLYGLGGDDQLNGGTGNDTLDGGAGTNDTAVFVDAPGSVFVDLAAGTATGADGNDTLIGIESAIGGQFNDIIDSDAGPSFLGGEAGDDTLRGHDGNDNLRGGAGNDILDGGGGSQDLARYFETLGNVVVDLAAGTASSVDGVDTLIGIELAYGSNISNDTIFGDAGVNTLWGNGGDDTLDGRAGNDQLTGDISFDGGTGFDGDDLFIMHTGTGSDTITDFIAGTGSVDRVDVSDFGFADFTALLAATSDSGPNAVVQLSMADQVVLLGVAKASLHEDDFILA